MKSYPTISNTIATGKYIYAFAKLDGSNIRAEWNNKRGFYKFGSRNRLLGTDQFVIPKAERFIRQQEPIIEKICKDNRWDRLLLFYEFFGPKSFAGFHEEDDTHEVTLIDANPYKKGILLPKEFINIFSGKIPTAPLLYHGPCDGEFINLVREGRLEGMPFEGVVCKAAGKQGNLMFKIKSNAWYAALRERCKDDAEFERLK